MAAGACAQVRVLFDASKAETAGNADWIIDADQHNIGYSNGPAVLGQGDESNAQRIPTPAQSGINASTNETFWNGALSAWGVDCVKRGYEVETLPYNGGITYGSLGNQQDLGNYDVFIVDEPNIRFTASERDAIIHFVQNGGGLFMISDHDQSDRNGDGWDSPGIWNDLMTNNTVQGDPFGFSVDLLQFSQTSTNIAALPADTLLHGPMGNVSEVQWSGGTSLTLHPTDNASVTGIVYKTSANNTGTTNVLCARAHYGTGRVAIIGDSSPCEDGTGDPNDQLYNGYFVDANGNHQRLLMNTTIWLVGNIATGISDGSAIKDFLPYPNPASDMIMLHGAASGAFDVVLRDALGREVRAWRSLQGENEELRIDGCAPGLYSIAIMQEGRRSFRQLIVR